jgi:hypothetical protein
MKYTIICVALAVMAGSLVFRQIQNLSPEKTLLKSVSSYQSIVTKPHAWWLDTGVDALNGPKNREALERIDHILAVLKDYKDVNDTTQRLYPIICRSAWGVVVDTKTTHSGRKTVVIKEGKAPLLVFVARDYGQQKDMIQELLCYRTDYHSVYIGAFEMPPVFLAATLYHEVGHSQQGILLYDKKDLPTVEVPMHKLSLEIFCAEAPEYQERLKMIASRPHESVEEAIASISFQDLWYLDSVVLGDVARYGHLVPYMTTNHMLGVGFIRARGKFETESQVYNWLRKVFD